MQNLPALVLQLHLLAAVALRVKGANLGDEVVGNLVGEGGTHNRLALGKRLHLLLELAHPAHAGARHGLIGRGRHFDDGREAVDGGHRRGGDDGGAVGIGDEALVPGDVLGVDLGHHERDLGVEPVGAGVVDDDGALRDGVGQELRGHVVFGGAQHDVAAGKGLWRGLLEHELFSPEGQAAAGTACRSQQTQLREGELALLQHPHHLPAHGAGCAQNGNAVFFHETSSLLFKKSSARPAGLRP